MNADWFQGIYDSLAFDKLLIHRTPRLVSRIYEIFVCNLIIYMIPYLLFGNRLVSLINLIGTLVHIIKYFDLVGAARDLNSQNTMIYDNIDMLGLALLMIAYQIIVQIIVWVLSSVFWPLSITVLLFYHAFYCFNNLWQCQGIPLTTRSKRIEQRWAYYGGYATISTLLYLYSNHLLISAFYNLFFGMNIILVFVVNPPKGDKYTPLNLSIFAYLTRLAVNLVKRVL